jgi:hypothetical protein
MSRKKKPQVVEAATPKTNQPSKIVKKQSINLFAIILIVAVFLMPILAMVVNTFGGRTAQNTQIVQPSSTVSPKEITVPANQNSQTTPAQTTPNQ